MHLTMISVTAMLQHKQACQTHLWPPAVNLGVGAQRITDIDRLCALQLPVTCCEGKGLGGEGPNRAQVDHITGQLACHELLDICAYLGVPASACHSQVLHA